MRAGLVDTVFCQAGNRRLNAMPESLMHTAPIVIILSSVVIIGLIWAALRITIKRDRATIKADMDEPHELQKYDENWKDKN